MDFSDVTPDRWLAEFEPAWGRMCLLAAQAHTAGAGQYRIRQAMEGKGIDYYGDAYQLRAIRQQRRHVVNLIKQSRACGISGAVRVHRMKEIHEAIGTEWMAPIPDLGL